MTSKLPQITYYILYITYYISHSMYYLREFALWILPSSQLSRVDPGSERMSFTSIGRRQPGDNRAKSFPIVAPIERAIWTPLGLANKWGALIKKIPIYLPTKHPLRSANKQVSLRTQSSLFIYEGPKFASVASASSMLSLPGLGPFLWEKSISSPIHLRRHW